MNANLTWLQQFYMSLCDGDWEHSYGFKIENCDNPGWLFEFELSETEYLDVLPPELRLGADLSGDGPDWIHLHRRDDKIQGACGPLMLDELLSEFRKWIEKSDAERNANAPNP